jgi:hypothetical protein
MGLKPANTRTMAMAPRKVRNTSKMEVASYTGWKMLGFPADFKKFLAEQVRGYAELVKIAKIEPQ